MSWALYVLAQNKHVQTKLRQEISNVSTDNPTMDDLNALPYLDVVVRETLRLYPAVPNVIRAAKKDDCIPLNKPFTDTKGIVRHEIRLAFDPIFLILLLSNLFFIVSLMMQGQERSTDTDTYPPHQSR